MTDQHRAYFQRNAAGLDAEMPRRARQFFDEEKKAAERAAAAHQEGFIRGLGASAKEWCIVEALKWLLLIGVVYLLLSL